MKKLRIFISLFVIGLLILPINVAAKAYFINDLTVYMNDSEWDVFTRDNIYNNSKLEELGLSYDDAKNMMEESNIYLNALNSSDDPTNKILISILMIESPEFTRNLRVLNDYEISEIEDTFKEKLGIDSCDIYKTSDNKFIHMQYYDSSSSYNVIRYYTVVNNYAYMIVVNKGNYFTTAELAKIQSIVDDIRFKYESYYDGTGKNKGSLLTKLLITVVVIIVFGFFKFIPKFFTFIFNKIKNIKKVTEYSFKCDNCGATVSEDAAECPKCHASFVDEEENKIKDETKEKVEKSNKKTDTKPDKKLEKKSDKKSDEKSKPKTNNNIDEKVSDLNKLKKLFDDKVITKKEFKKEKKKILK